jgi:CHAT domain-containing protein/tetratricopeptide (TPR) repeat protein
MAVTIRFFMRGVLLGGVVGTLRRISATVRDYVPAFHSKMEKDRAPWQNSLSHMKEFARTRYTFVLLGLVTCVALAGQPESADELLKRGADNMVKGRIDSALVCYYRAEHLLARDSSSRAALYTCRTMIATALYQMNLLTEADSICTQVEREGGNELGRDNIVFAKTYEIMALINSAEDHYAKADAYVARALAIREKNLAPSDSRIADSHYTAAVIKRKEGKYKEAEEHLRTALSIYDVRRPSQALALAGAYSILSAVHGAMDRSVEAKADIMKALDVLHAHHLENTYPEAFCLHSLSFYQADLGEVEEAMKTERRVAALVRQLYGRHHSMYTSSIAHLADCLTVLGDYETALQQYREALRLATNVNGMQNVLPPDIQRRIAHLFYEKGEYDSAGVWLREARTGLERFLGPDHPRMADVYRQSGDISEKNGAFAIARTYYGRALRIRERIRPEGAQVEAVDLWCRVAQTYLNQGILDSCALGLARAERLCPAEASGGGGLLARIYRIQGDLAVARFRDASALEWYQQALHALAPSFSDTTPSANPAVPAPSLCREYSTILERKAALLSSRIGGAGEDRERRLGSSLDAYMCAIRAEERLRQYYLTERSKLALEEKTSPLFFSAQETALSLAKVSGDPKYVRTAFEIAERGRSPLLRETLTRALNPGGDSTRARLSSEGRAIGILDRTLEFASYMGDSARVASLRTRLVEKIGAYQTLLDSVEGAYADRVVTDAHTRDLRALQARLGDSTVVIEYALSPRRLLAYLVTGDTLRVEDRSLPAAFFSSVRDFVQSIRIFDKQGYLTAANTVSMALLSPFRSTLVRTKKLIVIPDSRLERVPFEALLLQPLRGGQPGTADFARLPYLLRSMEVQYAPTAYVVAMGARDQPRESGEPKSFAGFAPLTGEHQGVQLAARTNGRTREALGEGAIAFGGRTYQDLPESGREVEGIAKLFRSAGGEGVAFTGANATKNRFARIAAGYDVLHIASHGFYNDDLPDLSGILFEGGMDSLNDSGDVQLFSLPEAYALQLHSGLVVLSSCESGAGLTSRGEGVVGLTRGLLMAGARHVVFSLWDVRDKATRDLMDRFYRYVLRGYDYPQALRLAKLSFLATRETSFPLSWAAFVITGE